jgi:putative transposase
VSQNLFWLTDEQWNRIEPHLPTNVRGKDRVDDRRVISGIVHVLKSGCRWCDCPAAYGPPTTIYNRFVHWARSGVWEVLFRALSGKISRHADDRFHACQSTPLGSGRKGGQRQAVGGATRKSMHSRMLRAVFSPSS